MQLVRSRFSFSFSPAVENHYGALVFLRFGLGTLFGVVCTATLNWELLGVFETSLGLCAQQVLGWGSPSRKPSFSAYYLFVC